MENTSFLKGFEKRALSEETAMTLARTIPFGAALGMLAGSAVANKKLRNL